MSSDHEILLQVRHDDGYAVFLHEIAPVQEDLKTRFRVRVVSLAHNDMIIEQFLDDESWGEAIFDQQVEHFIDKPVASAVQEAMPQAMGTPTYTDNPLFGRF